jgi:hypothetical protein
MKKISEASSGDYMFFENLKIIKMHVDEMLKMDESKVKDLLSNGHDWASDHLSTAKDDIEEVAHFLQTGESARPETKRFD